MQELLRGKAQLLKGTVRLLLLSASALTIQWSSAPRIIKMSVDMGPVLLNFLRVTLKFVEKLMCYINRICPFIASFCHFSNQNINQIMSTISNPM